MTNNGPADGHFKIPGGTLQYNAKRDVRFPSIYEISTHSLVHSPEYVKTIWIHIVDTSIEARKTRAEFEKTLSVPLGPDAFMNHYGPSQNWFGYLFNLNFSIQVYWN